MVVAGTQHDGREVQGGEVRKRRIAVPLDLRLGSVTRDGASVPAWLRGLAEDASGTGVPAPLVPPPVGGTPAAVLVLVAEGLDGPDVLLTMRGKRMRLHAGEAAFPGGAVDVEDAGPVEAALREATEEVGIDPRDVDVVGTLRELYIPLTAFRVVPVLAWWRRPRAVVPSDAGEVAAVERVSMRQLADPACRLMLHRPDGIVLPAFQVRDMLIWGMTAAVLDQLLALAGWERPWDSRVVEWP